MQDIMDGITLHMRSYKHTIHLLGFSGMNNRLHTFLVSSVGTITRNNTLRSLSGFWAEGMLAALCGLGKP